MAKPSESYSLWLKRRLEYADGLTKEARAVEIARVRSSVVDFKARNLDNLGAGFFDLMLAELDAAGGKVVPIKPKPSAPEAVGAFD